MDSLPVPRRPGTASWRHRSDWRRFVRYTAPHGHLDHPQRVDDRPVRRRERPPSTSGMPTFVTRLAATSA
eukprot:3212660-Pyramimonas_sp.AAC.1